MRGFGVKIEAAFSLETVSSKCNDEKRDVKGNTRLSRISRVTNGKLGWEREQRREKQQTKSKDPNALSFQHAQPRRRGNTPTAHVTLVVPGPGAWVAPFLSCWDMQERPIEFSRETGVLKLCES
jgi:hypothetical protein